MTNEQRSLLEREARYLHARFFGGDAPPEVAERYVEAHRRYLPIVDSRVQGMMETILERRLDPEALELALRIRRGDRFLTRKIQILFYLVEVRADYYDRFVNSHSGRGRAWLELTGGALSTAAKYIKGSCAVWKYDF